MARLSCIVLIAGFALLCVHAKAEELYSDRFDDIDVKAIFANEKLRQQYHRCLVETGPCNLAPSRFFKEILGDILQTQCRKCSEKQKQNLEYIIDWYTANKPAEWQQIVAKALEGIQNKKLKAQ